MPWLWAASRIQRSDRMDISGHLAKASIEPPGCGGGGGRVKGRYGDRCQRCATFQSTRPAMPGRCRKLEACHKVQGRAPKCGSVRMLRSHKGRSKLALTR